MLPVIDDSESAHISITPDNTEPSLWHIKYMCDINICPTSRSVVLLSPYALYINMTPAVP